MEYKSLIGNFDWKEIQDGGEFFGLKVVGETVPTPGMRPVRVVQFQDGVMPITSLPPSFTILAIGKIEQTKN
jgi:hypothetical protein